jgi:hypothetical protein
MCALFSFSGLTWSIASLFWFDSTENLWIQTQSCLAYTIGHWLFCYHYYTVAKGAKVLIEDGPETHASYFKKGWFNIIAICVQVILIESVTFY